MKLQKTDRLRKKAEFDAVFQSAHGKGRNARIFRAGVFTIYQKSSDSKPRLGLSIARRVIRRAHERNRIRRILREFFRLNRDLFQGDLILRVHSAPRSYDFETITRPVAQLLSIKLVKKEAVL